MRSLVKCRTKLGELHDSYLDTNKGLEAVQARWARKRDLEREIVVQQQTPLTKPPSQQYTMPEQSIAEKTPAVHHAREISSWEDAIGYPPWNGHYSSQSSFKDLSWHWGDPFDGYFLQPCTQSSGKKRKKRKIDDSQALLPQKTSQASPLEVLWKGTSTAPSDELGKLTQFISACASATMDKAIEVQELLREEDEKIASLIKHSSIRKNNWEHNGKLN